MLDYRERAAECIAKARRTADFNSKVLLLHLAQAWLELAEESNAPQWKGPPLATNWLGTY